MRFLERYIVREKLSACLAAFAGLRVVCDTEKRCLGSVTSSWGCCCSFEDSIVAAEAVKQFAGVGVEHIISNFRAPQPIWQSV